jgi:hypothetical protein
MFVFACMSFFFAGPCSCSRPPNTFIAPSSHHHCAIFSPSQMPPLYREARRGGVYGCSSLRAHHQFRGVSNIACDQFPLQCPPPLLPSPHKYRHHHGHRKASPVSGGVCEGPCIPGSAARRLHGTQPKAAQDSRLRASGIV